METFWICATVIFCLLWLVTMGHGNAAVERAEEAEKEIRRLDGLNLKHETTIADLNLALDVTLDAIESEVKDTKALREIFLRQAHAERFQADRDIDTITQDIERGMAG